MHSSCADRTLQRITIHNTHKKAPIMPHLIETGVRLNARVRRRIWPLDLRQSRIRCALIEEELRLDSMRQLETIRWPRGRVEWGAGAF